MLPAPVLEAPVIEAPVQSTQVLPAPVLLALLERHSAQKFLISKALTPFCRKFGNVVNRAFWVLIFWLKKLAGANFTRFCNYVQGEQNWRCHFAVVRQTIVDKLIGLEMEDRMYCGQFGEQFNPNPITFNHACMQCDTS